MKATLRAGIALLACLALLGPASAAQAQGRGNGGQGGGNGGQGGGKGGGQGGSQNAVLFGDLYVIERDGNGVPITKTFGTDICVQPIGANCALLPLKGDDPEFDPEVDDACDVQDAFVDQLQEVTFGRQSVARAPATVLDKSYYEALNAFNEAAAYAATNPVTPYGLDPAGRIVLTLPDELTGEPVLKTIDAPLENLGLYRALMTTGCLGPVTIEREPGVPLPMQLSADAAARLVAAGFGDLVCGATTGITDLDMFRAAAFYAAAADKTDPVTIDEVVNVNTYLGINTLTTGTTPRTKKQVTITWFSFTAGGVPYTYDRATTHPPTAVTEGAGRVLPTVASILTNPSADAVNFQAADVSLFLATPPGVDLPAVDVQVCRAGVPSESVCLSATDPGGDCGGANWFTQTAEDARKIVWFLHNWTVPEIAY